MKYLFLLNSIVTLVISIFLVHSFFKHYKNKNIDKASHWLSTIFFGYVLLIIISFSWFLDYVVYDSIDFTFIYAMIILFQTIIFFKVIYSYFYRNKKMLYLLILYIISILLVYFSPLHFPIFVLILSFLFTLLISFTFISQSQFIKKAGYIGIIYSCASIIFTFLTLLGIGEPYVLYFFSNVLFSIFIFSFLGNIKHYHITHKSKIRLKKKAPANLFLKYFIYIIVITNFVLISTITIHEIGHVVASKYYDCESRAIIYEEGSYPHTEIICDDLRGSVPIALAGLILPIIVGLILFLIGGPFVRAMALLMIGFNFIASYKDIIDMGLTSNIALTSSIIGLIFLFIGVVFLARSKVKEQFEF